MPGLVRRELERLPPLYWALWLGTLVNKAGGFVLPFLALYVGKTLGFGEERAGTAMSLYGAGGLVAALVGGALADQLGRRPTMLLSLVGGAAATVALGEARSMPAIALASFAVGALAEMYRPAVNAMVVDIVPPAHRALAYGRLYWAVNLGFAIAPPLAALALRADVRLLFWVDAATMLGFALVTLRFPDTRPRPDASATGAPTRASVFSPLADGTFVAVIGLAAAVAFVMWQNGTALPLDMIGKGIAPETYAALMSVNGVLIVFLQPVVTPRLSGFRRTRVLASATLVFGLGFGLYAAARTPLTYGLAITTWTLGEIALLPTASAVIGDLAPATMRGRYQGIHSMAWGGASALAPFIGGRVLARAGSTTLWLGCAALMALTALGHLLVGPRREARENAHVVD